MPDPTIEALFDESRSFAPPVGFAGPDTVTGDEIYDEAKDSENYWAAEAAKYVWRKPWNQILDWTNAPFAQWFVGGTLNITESCLDRHLAEHADRVAYYWEGEPGDTRTLTYADLHAEVCRLSNALTELGVQPDDRVAIYMGMVPELPAALLACARIGAPHSVIFGGFSAEALRDRIIDAHAKVLITCDGAWRNGAVVPLKLWADEAVAQTPSIEKVLVVQRTKNDVEMVEGRDVWYHDIVPRQPETFAAVERDSEDLLYMLYSSGTTAKPKGIVHTTGGYLVGTASTHRMVFDLRPETDIYWCTADIGWVTGHSYIVYG
ncbi:MAG TPA: AMP-binding protein, partial [Acidothermaceae bacterium]|nr:AMP-binding protein [Acidothermaceae bacterium]